MTTIEKLVQDINKLTGLKIAMDEPCVEQAEKMELEQRKEDFREGWKGNKSKDWNCEFYLIKYINNDFKSE